MRNIVVLILAGGALIFSLLAYQRAEEVAEVIHRMSAEANQEAFQRNRVVVLGHQLENLIRSMSPSPRPAAPPAR
jgi:hypothetical protein